MRHISNINPETKLGSVTKEDIGWLTKALESSMIHDNYKKIGVIPQCYQVDETKGIRNPIGLNGKEIKAGGLLVMDSKNHIANLEKAINMALANDDDDDYEFDSTLIPVSASFASAMSVLSEEQKENGVAILDIGESCSDLAVFYMNYPIFIWSYKFAGEEISREIKTVLNISNEEALRIKENYAYATPQKAGQKETIEVISNTGEGGMLRLENLAQWVYEPIKYLFENVLNVLNSGIDRTTYKNIIAQTGIVLTGGTANLKEISFVAQEVLELPVRIGRPNAVKVNSEFYEMNNDMSFSTLLGLCIYGTQNYVFEGTSGRKKKKKSNAKAKIGGGIGEKLGNFFKELKETLGNIEISK
jgi:cell division protein FtsA